MGEDKPDGANEYQSKACWALRDLAERIDRGEYHLLDFRMSKPVEEIEPTSDGYKQWAHTGDMYINLHLSFKPKRNGETE